MPVYYIQFDETSRRQCRVEADSPDEAIEQFWDDDLAADSVEIDGGAVSGLSMTDRARNPVVWGDRTTL